MKMRLLHKCPVGLLALLSFVVIAMEVPLIGQDQANPDKPFTQTYDNSKSIYYDRTKAVPQSQSRAQEEADRLVALSADTIISLLTQEQGLLLECKKLLVRTAFEQGRILDKDDLTDNAVFTLVRQDEKVRSLFTSEISDRYYIRA